MKSWQTLVAVALLTLIAGCDAGPKSARGFTLPDGDVEAGKAAFLGFRCYDCHTIKGVDLPVAEQPGQVLVHLGGKVGRIKTYGELVTSIINPSHRLAKGYAEANVAREGKSNMTVYNDVMTVRELTDLVAFLQSHYELRVYEPTHYSPYF